MLWEILKKRKEEIGMTTAALSKLSGVPQGTVSKILNGETRSPCYDTIAALERVLFSESEFSLVKEVSAAYAGRNQGMYTIEDYRALPEDVRAELIDGELIYMEAPSMAHQIFLTKILLQLNWYIEANHGDCLAVPAPLDVQLDCDDKTMLQPDISVICEREKVHKKGVWGAPDMVIEITSPSTRSLDYARKMSKYQDAGVKEYWIVDLQKKKVITYYFEKELLLSLYSLEDQVPVQIYDGMLKIDFSRITEQAAGLE